MQLGDWNDTLATFLNSTPKSVLIGDTFRIIEYNMKNPKAPLKLMNQRLVTFDIGFDVDQAPYFEPMYILIVERLTENGILMHLINKWRDFGKLHVDPEVAEAENLGLNKLAIGFKLYAVSLSAALIIFFAEFIIKFIKKIVNMLAFFTSLPFYFLNVRNN